ncbi:RNA recognition motif protein [Ceratobasidium sp. AG-Ba]|nr:RNA recognition motif protein [Ceratobasidium sp. AG-Ba]
MSAVAPAPPPVNPIPATNGVASEAPATTNNPGTAGDAATTSASQVPEEVGHKVFAGNLAYATTDEGLKTFFGAFTNDIISSEIIHRGSRPAGYGFVTFKTREAADKAVAELNDKELDGRPLIVEIAKPSAEKEKERNERRAKRRATGRRNTKAPPGEVTEAEAEGQHEHSAIQKAENAVEGAVAAVGDALKPKKKKKSNKKKVKKSTEATGESAPDANNQGEASAAGEPGVTSEAAPKKAKKPRAPRPPRAPRAVGEEPEGSPSKNMLFVANLPFSIDDARLNQIFTDAGVNVVSARVVRRRWGAPRSKGFGFVDVGNEEEQKKALAYFAPVEGPEGTTTGKEVEGRQIAVKIAVDAPKREAGETDADAAASAAQKSDSSPDATVVAH